MILPLPLMSLCSFFSFLLHFSKMIFGCDFLALLVDDQHQWCSSFHNKKKLSIPAHVWSIFPSSWSRTFHQSPSFFGHHCVEQLQCRLQPPHFGFLSHAHIGRLHILRGQPPSVLFSEVDLSTAPPSGQDEQGVSRHVSELEGKGAVEEHDEHAVEPLKDGRGVLQGEALLAEEDSAWRSKGQGERHSIRLI